MTVLAILCYIASIVLAFAAVGPTFLPVLDARHSPGLFKAAFIVLGIAVLLTLIAGVSS